MIVSEILKKKCPKISPLEAEILLCFVLKKEKTFLYKNPDFELSSYSSSKGARVLRKQSLYSLFTKLVSRRQKGEPIAYITNHQEFFGLDFYVDKQVLIPRPETEILVEEVLKEVRKLERIKKESELKIVDVGTGSGIIPIIILKNLKIKNYKLKIYGIDISKKSLQVAQKNAQKHQVTDKIIFLQGDLLKSLPEKVDIIVANLPYVKGGKTVPQFEPSNSLFGGKDGLDLIIKLIKQAPQYLKKSGRIFLEISPEQKEKLEKIIPKILPKAQFEFKKDLAGLDRILLLHFIQS